MRTHFEPAITKALRKPLHLSVNAEHVVSNEPGRIERLSRYPPDKTWRQWEPARTVIRHRGRLHVLINGIPKAVRSAATTTARPAQNPHPGEKQ